MEHEMFITADRVQGYDHEGLQDYNALFCLHSVLHIKSYISYHSKDILNDHEMVVN